MLSHMENYSSTLDSTFRALSDPTRRAVIANLARGSASVKQLAEPFEMGLPSFMKHLKVLEGSGLVTTVKVGRVRTCHISPDHLKVVESWLQEQHEIWEVRTNRLAAFAESLASTGEQNA